MIINSLTICYDPSHQAFAPTGSRVCQRVDSENPLAKVIRAVLRVNEIDAETWTNYSIHRCYCKSKVKAQYDSELEGPLNATWSLDRLETREGDPLFIIKIDKKADVAAQTSAKEGPGIGVRANATSADLSLARAQGHSQAETVIKTSHLERLAPQAASTAERISKVVGGENWKTQPIGTLGPIQTRGQDALRLLLRAAKTSIEIPQASSSQKSGHFNSDLVEALTRSYQSRVNRWSGGARDPNFFKLGMSDYDKANGLLKGKIERNGSWESSAPTSTLLDPAIRFPLSDSGLSGRALSTARDVSACWGNDEWLNQEPMPGMSQISMGSPSLYTTLRQIAYLTRVKAGEAAPTGMPETVLKAVRTCIDRNQQAYDRKNRRPRNFGWNQLRNIKETLALLKSRVTNGAAASASSGETPAGAAGDVEDDSKNLD